MSDYWLSILEAQQALSISKILTLNEKTKAFGVTLSKEETLVLLEARKNSLKEQERVEFSDGILPSLIETFCDSPYIYQDNYVESLERLQDIFYYYKNASLDELTDDELLQCMKQYFDGICQGSLDYLEDTCLDTFARKIRRGCPSFLTGHQNLPYNQDFTEREEEEDDYDGSY